MGREAGPIPTLLALAAFIIAVLAISGAFAQVIGPNGVTGPAISQPAVYLNALAHGRTKTGEIVAIVVDNSGHPICSGEQP